MYWRYLHQHKQAQIQKHVMHKNTTITNYDYRVGDQVLIRNKVEFIYETLLKVPYEIPQTWTYRTVTLQTGAVTTIINTRNINTYNTPNAE